MFDINRADQCAADMRADISRIFVDGFGQWLHYFSKDNTKLAAAFAHMFDLSHFYVALSDGKPAAITALTDGKTSCVQLQGAPLRRHLGWFRGTLALLMLKKELQNHAYPFDVEPHTGSIEFVATAPDYRGQGAATALIQHLTTTGAYRDYILEVADTNQSAVKLYTKLGFVEFTRLPQKHTKHSGINALVYMKITP